MVPRCRVDLRVAIAFVLAALFVSPARADSWAPREDVGVAAVDTRTGKVLWEAWRLDEVPAGASKEEKAAVEYLLGMGKRSDKPRPQVALLPDVPVKDLVIKNPWPERWRSGVSASQGERLIYFCTGEGMIALDRKTKEEAWRLLTTRYPYPSLVLEPGENLAFIQIGSDVPATVHAALVGGGQSHLTMPGLEPHTLKQRAAAAALLHHYGDGHLRPEVQKLVELLRAVKDDPAAATVANAVEKLLTDWPKTRDRQRLLEGCVATLLGAAGDPLKDFAWPGAQRVLAWSLLQEFVYGGPRDGYSRQGFNYAYDPWDEQPVLLPDATKAKLADHCRKVVADGPDAEKPFAASVLVSTAVGWSRLTDAERKKLFLSADPSAWRWAALALEKNGRRKELMEWIRERPIGDHLDVICLVWGREYDKRAEWPEEKLKFWVAVARHDPGGVANLLRRYDGPAPTEFREPIHEYLQREIAKPTVKDNGTQPSYSLSAALTVLGAWKNEDDTPLLLEYLKHPAANTVTRIGGGPRTEVRIYELRALVGSLLKDRGVKVPPGVVYEEEVGPGKE